MWLVIIVLSILIIYLIAKVNGLQHVNGEKESELKPTPDITYHIVAFLLSPFLRNTKK